MLGKNPLRVVLKMFFIFLVELPIYIFIRVSNVIHVCKQYVKLIHNYLDSFALFYLRISKILRTYLLKSLNGSTLFVQIVVLLCKLRFIPLHFNRHNLKNFSSKNVYDLLAVSGFL